MSIEAGTTAVDSNLA